MVNIIFLKISYVFEYTINVFFTNMCNSSLNPTKLSNEASMFCIVLFYQHMFTMFSNTKQLNCIIFSKTKLALKKNVTYLCDVFMDTILV